jgi:hypothetical protein
VSAINRLSSYGVTDSDAVPPLVSSHGTAAPDEENDAAVDDEEPTPTLIHVGEYADRQAYYSPLRQSVVVGEVHGDEFTETGYLPADDPDGLVGHVRNFVDTAETEGVDFAVSTQALALLYGDALATEGVLSRRQATVYLLRSVFGVERRRTAALLGISPSTVDSHLRNASSTVDGVRALVDALDAIEDDPTEVR